MMRQPCIAVSRCILPSPVQSSQVMSSQPRPVRSFRVAAPHILSHQASRAQPQRVGSNLVIANPVKPANSCRIRSRLSLPYPVKSSQPCLARSGPVGLWKVGPIRVPSTHVQGEVRTTPLANLTNPAE